MATWFVFEWKRHLDIFIDLSYLGLWKTEDQPSQQQIIFFQRSRNNNRVSRFERDILFRFFPS